MPPSAFVAIFDACVLYPAPLRDFLMHLALTGLFQAKWTNQIHDEWMESLLRSRPDLTRAQLERTRALMNKHVLDCLVVDYESLIDGLTLPDPDDRHVLAAAIRSGATVIVTYNLKDFPDAILHPLGIEAQHPDAFVAQLLELDPAAVCTAAQRQRAMLKSPPRNVAEFLDKLEQQALTRTVATLRCLTQWL